MNNVLQEVKGNFSKQLEDVVGTINKLVRETESLKVKQQQLIGAVYAMDIAMQEANKAAETQAVMDIAIQEASAQE